MSEHWKLTVTFKSLSLGQPDDDGLLDLSPLYSIKTVRSCGKLRFILNSVVPSDGYFTPAMFKSVAKISTLLTGAEIVDDSIPGPDISNGTRISVS